MKFSHWLTTYDMYRIEHATIIRVFGTRHCTQCDCSVVVSLLVSQKHFKAIRDKPRNRAIFCKTAVCNSSDSMHDRPIFFRRKSTESVRTERGVLVILKCLLEKTYIISLNIILENGEIDEANSTRYVFSQRKVSGLLWSFDGRF